MSNQQFIAAAKRSARDAIASEEGGDYEEAIRLYNNALQQLHTAMGYEHDEEGLRILTAHTAAYRERVEQLEFLQTAPSTTTSSSTTRQSTQLLCEPTCDDAPPTMSEIQVRPDVTWKDIIGLELVKKMLHTTVVLPREMPQIFYGNRRPARSLLLYGPSGVGKTHIVKALANECGMTFFTFSAADIMNKWVGESEKRVKAMFQAAREARPSILFIDEIDALCLDRDQSTGGGSGASSTKVVTEFLVQMDGLSHDMEGILFVGTTNRPQSLDLGILSRMERKIYIPLPNERDRCEMLHYHLAKNDQDVGDPLNPQALNELARSLELYSARDIATLVRVAQEKTAQQIVEATHFRGVRRPDGSQVVIPCLAYEQGAMALRYDQIVDKSLLSAPMLTLEQLSETTKAIKPVCNYETLKSFEQWTLDHGEQQQ